MQSGWELYWAIQALIANIQDTKSYQIDIRFNLINITFFF